MVNSRKNPLEVVAILKHAPWLTQKQLVERLGWNQRDVSRVLDQLEVAKRGNGGRTTAFMYAIKLPRQKALALESRREEHQ